MLLSCSLQNSLPVVIDPANMMELCCFQIQIEITRQTDFYEIAINFSNAKSLENLSTFLYSQIVMCCLT